MSVNPLIDNLAGRMKALEREAAALEGIPAARQMALRLEQALRRLATLDAVRRPLQVALLGGTGVGKSLLFNALIGRTDASPTSDAERCYTRQPHIAVSEQERPLVQVPAELHPVFVNGTTSGLALCDTPDVDGMLQVNRDVARSLIEQSDLVVYVADPDKRADFAIAQEVREWAGRKRWFFVMNKMDRYEADFPKIRVDFDRRLRELGFDPDDTGRFLVSARHPERYDFPRLYSALFQPRSEDQVTHLRLDGFLRYARHAVPEDILAEVEAKKRKLQDAEAKLCEHIHQAYREGLRNPDAAESFRLVVREAVWRHLGPRCGWFMTWPVWLRCRFSILWASYQVSRLTWRGLSIFGLVGVAISSLWAAARGMAPLRQVVIALGPAYRRSLNEVAADARRTLEEQGLLNLAPPVEEKEAPAPAAETSQAGGLTALLESTLRKLTLQGADEHVLAQLESDVERLGQQMARRLTVGPTGWFWWLLTNLPPAAMLGWILYRMGESWWFAEYLPWPFYGMAIPLLLASFLPGMLILSWRVRGTTTRLQASDLVEQVEQPPATSLLRIACERLDQFAQNTRQLRQAIDDVRHTITRESDLDLDTLGLSLRNGQT